MRVAPMCWAGPEEFALNAAALNPPTAPPAFDYMAARLTASRELAEALPVLPAWRLTLDHLTRLHAWHEEKAAAEKTPALRDWHRVSAFQVSRMIDERRE